MYLLHKERALDPELESIENARTALEVFAKNIRLATGIMIDKRGVESELDVLRLKRIGMLSENEIVGTPWTQEEINVFKLYQSSIRPVLCSRCSNPYNADRYGFNCPVCENRQRWYFAGLFQRVKKDKPPE